MSVRVSERERVRQRERVSVRVRQRERVSLRVRQRERVRGRVRQRERERERDIVCVTHRIKNRRVGPAIVGENKMDPECAYDLAAAAAAA